MNSCVTIPDVVMIK